jgi:UDP-N-acetylmuramate dehydrogenase
MVPLKTLSSFRIGGPAFLLGEPGNLEELLKMAKFSEEKGLPFYVLGKGSNVLFDDLGFYGIVALLSKGFGGVEALVKDDEDKDGDKDGDGEAIREIRVGAGLSLSGLIRWGETEGYDGFSHLAGIPGTVGGSIKMNAGVKAGSIGDMVLGIKVLGKDLKVRDYEREDLIFSYRSFKIKEDGEDTERVDPSTPTPSSPSTPSPPADPLGRPGGAGLSGLSSGIIIEAKLKAGRLVGREKAEELSKKALSQRTVTLGMGPSAGSVFRNPPGLFAGKLIEESGFKGKIRGEAMVSNRHANVIINLGNGSSSDVMSLIYAIMLKVYKDSQVELTLEIKIVNRWGEREI